MILVDMPTQSVTHSHSDQTLICILYVRRVCRYQRGNQNSQIEEGQTTQWSKEKGQKDKQRSTKYYT
jgi:hypothetical protein